MKKFLFQAIISISKISQILTLGLYVQCCQDGPYTRTGSSIRTLVLIRSVYFYEKVFILSKIATARLRFLRGWDSRDFNVIIQWKTVQRNRPCIMLTVVFKFHYSLLLLLSRWVLIFFEKPHIGPY